MAALRAWRGTAAAERRAQPGRNLKIPAPGSGLDAGLGAA